MARVGSSLDLKEKKLSSEEIFRGKVFRVFRDTAQLPNGKTAVRDVVRHNGGVIIVPVDGDGNVHMVRQFRYPCDRVLLEVPAGKLEAGEDPFSAAVRELEEEVGATAGHWEDLGKVLPTPGFCDEVHHLYLAEQLTMGKTHPDEDEFLEQTVIPLGEACAMALDGRIGDSKTIIALLRAKARREEVHHG